MKIYFFSVFVFLLLLLCLNTVYASEPEESMPSPMYYLYSVDDLKAIEYQPEVDADFYLMNDIEITEETWKPIGSTHRPFRGIFHGNNYTITFTKDTELLPSFGPESSINGNGSGLFGNVYAGTISDLNIVLQGNLTSKSNYVGPLVGFVSGNNSSFRTPSSFILNCTVQSQNHTIYGKNNVGGLVGYLDNGGITSCFSDCSVKAEENNSGGLIGYASNSSISDSSSSGVVEAGKSNGGGLIGYSKLNNNSNVSATGAVKSKEYAGGLVGYISKTTIISDSSADGDVKPKGAFGNFIGGWDENYKPTVSNCFYQETEVDLEPVPPLPYSIVCGKSYLLFYLAAGIGIILIAAAGIIYFKKRK